MRKNSSVGPLTADALSVERPQRSARPKKHSPSAEQHLTPEALAERVGVPLETVYRWNSRGGGPRRMKLGRHVRYRLADVIAWEDANYITDNDAA
ncbi:helix-turn-helix transcriptional regulator [Actinomadura rupiterrae]|uniref:helix-turn-helix transcriptional regulator n=1 Tax=Actinomadura rupiterrae TaxID=559627 RepID=UPI0020A46E60|nr:helix-turn-helix domain-containing protein [Actinomadura rupiterrae]MCP2336141.1 excisionase family DNA binding protein [Actinomadura rupiterrae]